MEVVYKLMAYAIPIVVLILLAIFFFGGEGGFTKLKNTFSKTKSYLPDLTLGAERLQAEKPALPPYHEQAVRRLVETIQTMLNSDRQHCFATYGGLPELGEKGTVLKLAAGSITTYTLGGRQEITDLNQELAAKLAGFKPCVIAGPLSENFEKSFLNEEQGAAKKIVEPLYLPVQEIVIKHDGDNKIDFGYGDKDLEDGGMLYSPAKGLVCFFPTVDMVQNMDKYDGLNDDYLGEDKSLSLSRQLNEKKILPCTGPGEEPSIAQQPTPDEILPGGVPEPMTG